MFFKNVCMQLFDIIHTIYTSEMCSSIGSQIKSSNIKYKYIIISINMHNSVCGWKIAPAWCKGLLLPTLLFFFKLWLDISGTLTPQNVLYMALTIPKHLTWSPQAVQLQSVYLPEIMQNIVYAAKAEWNMRHFKKGEIWKMRPGQSTLSRLTASICWGRWMRVEAKKEEVEETLNGRCWRDEQGRERWKEGGEMEGEVSCFAGSHSELQ